MILRQIISKIKTPVVGCYRSLVSPKFRLVPQLILVYCAAEVPQKIEISAPTTLTHEFLLKQSSGVTATAVAQLLHQTVTAYIDTANIYMKALRKQISLVDEFGSKIGDAYAEEELSDAIIESRAEVKKHKEEFLQLESLLIYVEDLVNSATQATFLGGAEYLSLTLCEQLISAKREMQRAKSEVELTEQTYLTAEKEAIEKERKKKGEESFFK